MTLRERKLVRKQINLKLKCLANIESKENDFFNSSQILTERQQMYMTISKHFRAQDNRRKPRNLPFDVDTKSLPHVNLSLLGRLYETTNDIVESESMGKILKAHSFRVATPFYTNPLWTIDSGKIMNYSSHVGSILHTPRYIDFIKNSPEYGSTTKSHQQSGSDKRKGLSPSQSLTSTSILSLTSGSSTERSRTGTKSSFTTVKSSDYISQDANKNGHQDPMLVSPSPSRASRLSVAMAKSNSRAKTPTLISGRSSINKDTEIRRTPQTPREISLESEEDISVEPQSTSQEEGKTDTSLLRQDACCVESESGREDDVTSDVVITKSQLLQDIDDFFKDRIIEKEDFNLICKYFDIVDNHRLSNPDYVRACGIDFLKSNVEHFETFHGLISALQISNISNEDSEVIFKWIRSYESTHSSKLNRRPSTDSFFDNLSPRNTNAPKTTENGNSSSSGETLKDDEESSEKVNDDSVENDNIADTLGRVLPLEQVVDGYNIEIETEGDEEVTGNEKDKSAEDDVIDNLSPRNTNESKTTENGNSSSSGETLNDDEESSEKVNDDSVENGSIVDDVIDNTNVDKVESRDNNSLDDALNDDEESSEKENDEVDKNDNIMRTLERVFQLDQVVDNYNIEIETEGDEEVTENVREKSLEDDVIDKFTESFRDLYRNSVTEMSQEDKDGLGKLIAHYYYEEDDEDERPSDQDKDDVVKNFEALFLKERGGMVDDDIVNLKKLLANDLETYDGTRIEKFDELLGKYDQMSDNELEKVNKIISVEEGRRARRLSAPDDDLEENETMLAFRNLFRSSIGIIKTSDLEQIQKIIDEHEN